MSYDLFFRSKSTPVDPDEIIKYFSDRPCYKCQGAQAWYTNKDMRRIFLTAAMLILCVLSQAAQPPAVIAESDGNLSVTSTVKVSFIGKQFLLKDKATNQSVPVYEYFQAGDNPPAWEELVDFRIYPVNQDGNEPKDHAARTAKLFMQKYPYMKFALYESKSDGAVLLDFFYPTSSRKDGNFLEFNAFKFYKEPGSQVVMSFHYAKNIEGISKERAMSAVSTDIKSTRTELVPAMAAFPLYRQ